MCVNKPTKSRILVIVDPFHRSLYIQMSSMAVASFEAGSAYHSRAPEIIPDVRWRFF